MTRKSRTAAHHFKRFDRLLAAVFLAMVAIPVALALPAYQDRSAGENRSQAKAALLALAGAMEQHLALGGTYAGATEHGAPTPAAPSSALFPREALSNRAAHYELTIESADAKGYVLQARPITGSRQEDDGVLRLNHLGQKSWDRNNDGAIVWAEQTWDA
ncbi:type IV pilin protein [Haliea sp.]|uniref:type IV pilin protein n=1 Tax=Haliea sp. TaxID=1932666 RepID=UPI0025BD24FE|nr:type IV pilin protein [Haliea sp.]